MNVSESIQHGDWLIDWLNCNPRIVAGVRVVTELQGRMEKIKPDFSKKSIDEVYQMFYLELFDLIDSLVGDVRNNRG